jgi:hypothetical protein
VPEGECVGREALDARAHRYFETLTDQKAVAADYDDARLVKPGLEHTTGFGAHK